MSNPIEQVNNYFDSLIGKQINNTYLIEEKLGQGGMGAVFRATHTGQGNRVAIKIISPNLTSNHIFIKRFKREARVGGAISHPNIIKVYELGETEDGLLFMVMEFVEGETLNAYFKHSAPLSIDRALEILEPLSSALGAAHRRNILHRDLKPANVLISREDGKERIKLADFGIVKLLQPDEEISQGSNLTAMGEIFGTPHYMSPEQLMGHHVGPTTDIYSLGVITYEMLTGRVPIDARDLREFLMMKVTHDLTSPSSHYPFLPPALDRVLLKVLARDPEERYQTVKAFLEDFKSVASEISQSNAETLAEARRAYRSTLPSSDMETIPSSSAAAALSPAAQISAPTTQPETESSITTSQPTTFAGPNRRIWIGISLVLLLALILFLLFRGA